MQIPSDYNFFKATVKTGLLLSLLAVFFFSCKPSKEKSSSPNIVIVLVDDLGYSDIGAYGSEIATPNLDQLAEQGIRFTQMHNTSKCFPSRAALLTGLYPQRTSMHDSPDSLEHAVMFGEVLNQVSYNSIYVGKHHGTDNPYNWGFDHYHGLRDGAANYFNPGEKRAFDSGMPAHKDWAYPRKFVFDDSLVAPFTPSKGYYSTDSWTDWALELLESSKNEDSPFLLYLSYQAPHDPLQAPEESIKKYEGVYEEGYESIARSRYERQKKMGLIDDRYARSNPTYPSWETLSDSAKADQARRMQVYAAMIDRLDWNIGRVIDRIKSMGEWKNTLFMFASDNGASSEAVNIGKGPIGSMTRWASLKKDWANVANTPFRYYKNYSHGGGVLTPFIVHWPKMISKGGQVNHTPLHFIDFMPTLIDITDTEYPERYKGESVYQTKGISFLPLLDGEKIKRDQPLFFNWDQGSAIRTDRWKLVRWGDQWELYDMQTDRTETTNLADQYPQIVHKLSKRWNEWAGQVGIKSEQTGKN